MLGAVLGDIVGSRFEWNNLKSKDFTLLTNECRATDDTIMTVAIGSAVMKYKRQGGDLGELAVMEMRRFGRMYPDIGYGPTFRQWLVIDNPHPYNSWGNGAPMRVSSCGWAAESLLEALDLAKKVTEVTHNHPEGIKGAQAVAAAIYLARSGRSKQDIKKYIEDNFYRLDFTLDAIRPTYRFDVSCQGSVPQAIEAFLESDGLEDAIRNAVSIGVDSDTVAAISGSIAEAYYGCRFQTRFPLVQKYLVVEISKTLLEFHDFCRRDGFAAHGLSVIMPKERWNDCVEEKANLLGMDVEPGETSDADILVILTDGGEVAEEQRSVLEEAERQGKGVLVWNVGNESQAYEWFHNFSRKDRTWKLMVVVLDEHSKFLRESLGYMLFNQLEPYGRWPEAKQRELWRLHSEMHIIGRFDGYEIYTRTDEPDVSPHFHIRDAKTFGQKFHAAIRMDDFGYFEHKPMQYPWFEGRRDWLDEDMTQKVLAVLASEHPHRPARKRHKDSRWDVLVDTWGFNCGSRKRQEIPTLPTEVETVSDGDRGGWLDISTIGWPSLAGGKYRIAIRSMAADERSIPHFHVYSAELPLGADFEFEISLLDLLEKDELNLIYQKDLRNVKNQILESDPSKCSWNGYETMRDELRDFLAQKSEDDICYPGMTHLEMMIRRWDCENNDSDRVCDLVNMERLSDVAKPVMEAVYG